ncbi:4'-phosphopantetheinyl transferase family protein [Streptomyces sp. NPDC058157]|uniref:4'-phosphopantetheinyl transferase family protein n=1 Tax=Streptomyces sp. NPDC058157 TaxID=3346360 RepID=UPI0036E8023B
MTRSTPVDIWWWTTTGPTPAPHAEDASVLTGAERAAAARLPADRRADALAHRAAVRRILGRLLDVPPGEVEFGRRPCPGCADAAHGPPYVRHPGNALWISISHTGGCGVLAVAEHPVGIDVEHEARPWSPEAAAKALTPSEAAHLEAQRTPRARAHAFLTCWTRKEAALKAAGIGIVTDLSAVETHPAAPGPVTVHTPPPAPPTPWHTGPVPLPPPYLASLARSAPTADLRLHRYGA